MAAQKVQFSAGPVEDALTARTAVNESASLVAQRDLQRYYLLMKRSLPKFTHAQARLLVNALSVAGVYTLDRGTRSWPVDRAPIWAHVVEFVEQAAAQRDEARDLHETMPALVPDLMGRYDRTFGVDTEALIARLRTLTPCQEMAIVDAVEQIRYTESAVPPEESTGDEEVVLTLGDNELERVGLAITR